jgi:hypothetical protein
MAKKSAAATSAAGDAKADGEAEERRCPHQRGEPAAPRAVLPSSGAVTHLQGRDISWSWRPSPGRDVLAVHAGDG